LRLVQSAQILESETSETFAQLGEWSRKVPTRLFWSERWSKLELTRPIGLGSGVIYNLLGRAGLREAVVRLTTQHSWARGGVVNYTSGSRRSRGRVVSFTSVYSMLRGGLASFTTQYF